MHRQAMTHLLTRRCQDHLARREVSTVATRSNLTLQTVDSACRNVSSKCISSESRRKHGELICLKSRRGIERQFRRRKKAGWASIDSSWSNFVERRSTTLGTPVWQPLMSIGAPRILSSSRSVTVTPRRADWIAIMIF